MKNNLFISPTSDSLSAGTFTMLDVKGNISVYRLGDLQMTIDASQSKHDACLFESREGERHRIYTYFQARVYLPAKFQPETVNA